MSGTVEALYVYDSQNALILQHSWRHRPSSTPAELITLFDSYPSPRPPLIYVPNASPPTLLFSIVHNNLTFLSPTTAEIEPLLVLEFLHRVVDVLEDYFGSPLIPTKIEGNYDIVAELLSEMCDDGLLSNTEVNGLRDVVLPPSLMKKLLGNVTLPSGSLDSMRTQPGAISPIPWRRANVKHTSNEMYLDLIETLHCILAPSGRPLAARVNGTMAFTCQISGIPDMLLSLRSPSGRSMGGGGGTGKSFLQTPVFHPCVRLSRWNAQPGDLSFVPPDGKFVLASYEVNLLPNAPTGVDSFQLPVNLTMKTLLGPRSTEFEVRVWVPVSSPYFTPQASASSGSSSAAATAFARIGAQAAGNSIPARFESFGGGGGAGSGGGTSANPMLDDISVVIALPPQVRTVLNVRVSKGVFHHDTDRKNEIQWRFPPTQGGLAPGGSATLRAEVVTKAIMSDESESSGGGGGGGGSSTTGGSQSTASHFDGSYDATSRSSQSSAFASAANTGTSATTAAAGATTPSLAARAAMPRSATVNFTLKGALMSGLKVDSLKIVGGKGIGENVKPYKGVKYMTRAGGGSLEFRCSSAL